MATPSSACPSALTAMPALKSRYLRPSVSQTYEPLPCERTKSGRAYTPRRCACPRARTLAVAGDGEEVTCVAALYRVDGCGGSALGVWAGCEEGGIRTSEAGLAVVEERKREAVRVGRVRRMWRTVDVDPRCFIVLVVC